MTEDLSFLLALLKYGGAILFLVFLVMGAAFQVRQQTLAMVERFGKYHRRVTPGLNWKIPLVEKVAYQPSLRTEQKEISVQSITSDKVSVEVKVSIWVRIIAEKVYDAVYRLDDPYPQIESSVFDVVRAQIPRLTLDACFERKDDIRQAILDQLKDTMDDYGYIIDNALITDIDPDHNVKTAMNEINAAQRRREAAFELAEAEKVVAIKQAEADSARKRLQGEGIAAQRKAITTGLQEQIESFQIAVKGTTPADVMQMVLLTQWLDTLKEIGTHSNSNVIFASHNPGSLADIGEQIQKAILATGEVRS